MEVTTAAANDTYYIPQEFFVFNRDYLYADVDSIAHELTEEPALSPLPSEVEVIRPPTPRSLENIVSWSHSILEYVHSHASTSRDHYSALCIIQRSTSIALTNLLSHSANVKDGGSPEKEKSTRELDRMRNLISGYSRDLDVLGLVSVNNKLLPSTSSSSSSSVKRTLGDYVSRGKMGAVAEACNKVYIELHGRLDELNANFAQLEADTTELDAEVNGTHTQPSKETMEEVAQAEARAEELAASVIASCSPDSNGWPVADKLDDETMDTLQQGIEELYLLDEVARESVRRLTADKNDLAARSLTLLSDISSLQSDYADLSASLAAFHADVYSSRIDGFRHLARLNKMLWAYGATVIEAVRRREFNTHFLAKSQSLAELMAKVSSKERKRRNNYRSEVAGQLPWEVKGMDEAPPSLELSTSRTTPTGPELERRDVEDLLQMIDEIEATLAQADAISGDASNPSISDIKKQFQDLLARLDLMDDEFTALVERNLLEDDSETGEDEREGGSDSSTGELQRPRAKRLPRTNGVDHSHATELLAATRKENERLQQEVANLMRQAEQQERSDYEHHRAELATLRTEASTARSESRRLKEELEQISRDKSTALLELDTVRNDVKTERERRLNMQDELDLLRKEAQAAHKAEEDARHEASEEAERFAEVELHLNDVQAELEEAKAARNDATERIESLLSEGTNVEKELSAAQEHIETLLQQLESARAETRQARDAHTESEAAREKTIRHHRAEADGDRAILEETVRERESDLTVLRSELARIKETSKLDGDATQMLRSQLRGADEAHEELVRAMEAAEDAHAESELSKRHAEREREQMLDLVRPFLEQVLQLKSHVRRLPALSSRTASAATPAITDEKKQLEAIEDEDSEVEAARQAAIDAFLAAGSSPDPATTLAALQAVAPQVVGEEVIRKLDILVTLVRKWQKTYKRHSTDINAKLSTAVRERIAFRNFQAGDLALFLPSRNNALDPKPWAAFNISFPHYFLNAPGGSVLAEQLKAKEWIVARIVRIIERTTDVAIEGGNPFQLPNETKFCLLDVEGWNPTASNGSTTQRPKLRSNSTSPPELSQRASIDEEPAAVLSPMTAIPQQQGEDTRTPAVQSDDRPVESTDVQQTSTDSDPIGHLDASAGKGSQPSSTIISQAGFEAPVSSAAGQATPTASTPSSPSALTRALQAAKSRSPSMSRTQESASRVGLTTTQLFGQRPSSSSGVQHDNTRSYTGVQSTSGVAAPAFGIRGRRKGLNRSHNFDRSAATSPGMESSATGIHARQMELSLEAAGNPFSQSPGPTSEDDRLMSQRMRATASADAVRPLPSEEQATTTLSPSRLQPTVVEPAFARKTSTSSSRGARSPSLAGITINAGSLILAASPSSTVAAMAVPINAQARAERVDVTSPSGEGPEAGEEGTDAASPRYSNHSGLSIRSAGGSIGPANAKTTTGAGRPTSPPSLGTSRSPSFLSNTFGRKTSGAGGNKTPIHVVFGGGPRSNSGSPRTAGSGSQGAVAEESGQSAKEMLQRFSDKKK